jgi:hypothetical protein
MPISNFTAKLKLKQFTRLGWGKLMLYRNWIFEKQLGRSLIIDFSAAQLRAPVRNVLSIMGANE